MIAELIQNKIYLKRHIIVENNKIKYITSKFGKSSEVNIPYEDLTNFKESHSFTNHRLGVAALIFLFLSLIMLATINDKDFDLGGVLFWGLLCIISSTIYFFTNEEVWKIKLQNYTYIFINKKSPNQDEVNQFIEILLNQRKKYLYDNYAYINRNLAYESQFKNFQWLKKIEVIDNEEYKDWLAKLDKLFKSEKNTIGFLRE
jgi:hypothetical protein